jgi:hypothetical protein
MAFRVLPRLAGAQTAILPFCLPFAFIAPAAHVIRALPWALTFRWSKALLNQLSC